MYVPAKNFPVTVVKVASWYLLRHLHAKNDEELMNVSTQLQWKQHTQSETDTSHIHV